MIDFCFTVVCLLKFEFTEFILYFLKYESMEFILSLTSPTKIFKNLCAWHEKYLKIKPVCGLYGKGL